MRILLELWTCFYFLFLLDFVGFLFDFVGIRIQFRDVWITRLKIFARSSVPLLANCFVVKYCASVVFSVGSKRASVVTAELYDHVKADPTVIALNVPDVLAKGNASFDALKVLHAEVDPWKADVFCEKKEEAMRAIEVFKADFVELLDYKAGMQIAYEEKKEREDIEKRKVRTHRTKIKKLLTSNKWPVPDKYAQYIGHALQQYRGAEVYQCQIVSYASASAADRPGKFNGVDFSKPSLLLPSEGDAATHWHKAIQATVDKLKPDIDDKMRRVAVKFERDTAEDKIVYVAAMGNGDFKANDESGEETFDVHGVVVPLYTGQRKHRFAWEVSFSPYAGVTVFLRVVSGCAFVTCVPIASVLTHGRSIETLKDYLETVEVEWLQQNILSFVIPAGNSCYVPFGFVAIVVGLHESDEPSDGSFLSYVTLPVLDNNRTLACDQPSRIDIKNFITAGLAQGNKTLGANKVTLESWFETWPAIDVSKGVPSANMDDDDL
jgi:hypothetical protein